MSAPRELKYFDPVRLGEGLREISPDVIRPEANGLSCRWFQGLAEVDFFLWQDEKGHIIKQQLTLYGQVIEWNIIEGVRTGFILQQEEGIGQGMKASETIRFDATPVAESLKQAMALLTYARALKRKDLDVILHNFSENPTTSGMSHEEFLRRFGSIDQRPRRQGGLRRLWTWLARRLRL